MSEDKLRYDILASEALRGLIRTVLQRVQKRGLPGEHHFYITFDTRAPGTILSKRLKDQYPEEMTVVLQYQFWDLMVYDDRFEVKLSFNTIPERLVVPFSSIKSFYDPSVQFGFSPGLFVPAGAREKAFRETTPEGAETQDRAALPGPAPSLSDSHDVIDVDVIEDAAIDPDDDEAVRESAKVVELDQFRKK
jgi:uncharacterized protein